MAAASAKKIMASNEKVAMAKKTAAAKNKAAENNVKNGVSMAAKIMALERRIKSSQHGNNIVAKQYRRQRISEA
jgi:hypothetical protein